MTEERAQRRLTEAEGYLELELFEAALARVEEVEQSGRLPLECKLLRGNLHREREEYAESLPFFEAALALDPGNIAATVGLGWSLKRLDRVGEAAQIYEQALPHHPGEGLLHYNLACYRSLQGQAPEALAALDCALRISEEFKSLAREESDFDPIRDLPAFQERIEPPPESQNV